MEQEHEIRLNFLAIQQELPSFWIYRRERMDGEPSGDGTHGYTLPVADDAEERVSFLVSFKEADGFQRVMTKASANRYLTQQALFESLVEASKRHAESLKISFNVPKSGFYREVAFNCAEHAEGYEQLIVHPYYLREKKCFGWRVDFHFHLRDGVPFNRRVQQLSLSLDQTGRRNLNSYMDRARKIKSFLKHIDQILQDCKLPGLDTPLTFDNSFALLEAKRLDPKVYLFSGEAEATNQFSGLAKHGPKTQGELQTELLFAFRESDRASARKFAAALQGGRKRERYSFPAVCSLKYI